VAITWGICGTLFIMLPAGPAAASGGSSATVIQIGRGICISPAFAMGFMAYLAWRVSGRPNPSMTGAEVIAAVGTTWGLVLALFGVAIVIEQASQDQFGSQIVFAILCLVPGLFLIGLSTLFWWLTGQLELGQT
jgi:hypothetical protein